MEHLDKALKKKTIRRKRCTGGLADCKNYVDEYKDVEGVGCCKKCDKYVDDNPYDPYWEQMEQEFGESKEYKELDESDGDAYEKAFERFQETYEPWPVMRRRMEKVREKERREKERRERSLVNN